MLDQSGKRKILLLVLHNLSERKKKGASVVQANSKSKVAFYSITSLLGVFRSRFILSRAYEPCLACEHFISNWKSLTTPYIYSGGFIIKLHGAQNAEHFITAIYMLLFTVP